jgi:hypothetical protein
MNTWADVQSRLKAELEQWFIKQCRNNFKEYYLYYHPTTPKRDGGFMFAEDKPGENYLLGWNTPANKGATVDQNFNMFTDVLRRLPIMSI